MNIVVTGGAGFLGSRVIAALLAHGGGTGGIPAFERIVSVDLSPCPIQDSRIVSLSGDIADPAFARQAIGSDTVAVFHLAAVLSGQSEQDFDIAMRVNVDGTRALLEAARAAGNVPRFVFASSLAVYGGTLPEPVPETIALWPASSYGVDKAIGELLVNDYTRKGFIDGRACRLPTVVVRPGKPNSAAASCVSGIIREPLAGVPANCPVAVETRMWITSPSTVVANLLHALGLDGSAFGDWRSVNLPGLSVTVAEMLASLERLAGADVRALVTHNPEQRVIDLVKTWPGDFIVTGPLALGFVGDTSFDAIVRQYRDGLG